MCRVTVGLLVWVPDTRLRPCDLLTLTVAQTQRPATGAGDRSCNCSSWPCGGSSRSDTATMPALQDVQRHIPGRRARSRVRVLTRGLPVCALICAAASSPAALRRTARTPSALAPASTRAVSAPIPAQLPVATARFPVRSTSATTRRRWRRTRSGAQDLGHATHPVVGRPHQPVPAVPGAAGAEPATAGRHPNGKRRRVPGPRRAKRRQCVAALSASTRRAVIAPRAGPG